MRHELGRGAEAVIYREGDVVVKERPAKPYRHPSLDAALRKGRTKKEAKVLQDLQRLGVPAPTLISSNPHEGLLRMTFVQGVKLKEALDKDPSLATKVGEHLSTMHDADLVHGDLTTSNMILKDDRSLWFIDFGLSFNSTRVEDLAVDVHLWRQALASKHHPVESQAWSSFLEGYQPHRRALILKRLAMVEKRGRNKG